MAESIEEDLFRELYEYRRMIENLSRDRWITAKTRRNLVTLESDLDAAWAKFAKAERVGNPPGNPNDGGPTAADIAGEVRND